MKFSRIIALCAFTILFTYSQTHAQCSSSKSYSSKSHSSYSSAHGGAEADIVGLAASVDDLSTLVAAVKAAGLVDVLQGDGPFTVFAPTNEAFAALPHGTLEKLLKPENKQMLIDILTYHVASGAAEAGDLADGQRVKTVQGEKVLVTKNHSSVMIDNAKVVQADVEASNGVVHVINKVILPPSFN